MLPSLPLPKLPHIGRFRGRVSRGRNFGPIGSRGRSRTSQIPCEQGISGFISRMRLKPRDPCPHFQCVSWEIPARRKQGIFGAVAGSAISQAGNQVALSTDAGLRPSHRQADAGAHIRIGHSHNCPQKSRVWNREIVSPPRETTTGSIWPSGSAVACRSLA